MAQNEYSIIFTQRHPELVAKDDIWNLINKSYKGGIEYQNDNFLWKHSKESTKSFEVRSKRSVYFNQIAPLADLLSGFLFMKEPTRNKVENVNYLIEKANLKKKSMNEFMNTVATYSLLYTCGVLVESPNFDPDEVKTLKDRIDLDLDPYCVLYQPFQIRNFYHNENGELEWVILDNSFYDNSNFKSKGTTRKLYRLWTKEYYQDFEQNTSNIDEIIVGDQIEHNVGYVPFRFVNWKDDNSDFIAESVFEDPAMISRLIYNKMSEMDEMTSSGAFKVLLYPSKDGKLPASLTAGGIGSLSAIPYDGSYSAPSFDGASLDDVQPFLSAIEFYIAEILKKVGIDTDETKEYVKSGIAKKIDFQKMKTLLISGAVAMQGLEKWIFETAAKWENKTLTADIKYSQHYEDEDVQTQVQLLTELLTLPFAKLRRTVTGLMVDRVLSGEVTPEVIEEIKSEIENSPDESFEVNVDDIVEDEKNDNNGDNNNE